MSEPTLDNAFGFAKHIIGMCVDERPHLEIRKELERLVEMLATAPAVTTKSEGDSPHLGHWSTTSTITPLEDATPRTSTNHVTCLCDSCRNATPRTPHDTYPNWERVYQIHKERGLDMGAAMEVVLAELLATPRGEERKGQP